MEIEGRYRPGACGGPSRVARGDDEPDARPG